MLGFVTAATTHSQTYSTADESFIFIQKRSILMHGETNMSLHASPLTVTVLGGPKSVTVSRMSL